MIAHPAPEVKPAIPFRFRAVPSEIMASRTLGSTAKLLFGVIADAARGSRSNLCKLANATLADRVGRSESEVGRCILELEAAGLARRVFGDSKHTRIGIQLTWSESAPRDCATPRPEPPQERASGPPQAGNQVPRTRATSRTSCLDSIQVETDPAALIQMLHENGEADNAVALTADRLLVLFKDDIRFRSKYVRAMQALINGDISVAKAIHAAKEAARKASGRGIAFHNYLESTIKPPGERLKPSADSPEVQALVTKYRSSDERMRSHASGALLDLGFTVAEIQKLFAKQSPTPPAPIAQIAPRPTPASPTPSRLRKGWFKEPSLLTAEDWPGE